MTANVRGPADPGPAAWTARRDLLARVIRDAAPDVVGTQETTGAQRDDLLERLPDYRFLGRDHEGGADGEHTGLLWRPDRLELVEHGDFWLSDTPDVPGTGTWGGPTPRVVTWARFAREGIRFAVVNTHFPWPEDAAGEAGRTRCAEVLRAHALELAGADPVVVTADFNTAPGSDAHRELTRDLVDAAESAPTEGPEGTFHGFTGTPGARIDWILVRGLRATGVDTIDTHEGDVWPSDHLPVVAHLVTD